MAFLARLARPSMRLVASAPRVVPRLQVARAFAAAPNTRLAEDSLRSPAKAPLRIYGLQGRYAHAIFDAASQGNALEKVEADFKQIKQLVETNAEFKAILENPVLKPAVRQAAIEKYLDDIKASPVTRRFFALLVENRRTGSALSVIETYQRLLSHHRNEVTGVVTSAKPLQKEQLDKLSNGLKKKFLKPEEKLIIQTKIDPELLAGFQVQLGEKFIDMSLKTEIDRKVRDMTATVDQAFEKLPTPPA